MKYEDNMFIIYYNNRDKKYIDKLIDIIKKKNATNIIIFSY